MGIEAEFYFAKFTEISAGLGYCFLNFLPFRKLFSRLQISLIEQSYILQDFNVSFLGTVNYRIRMMRVRETLFLNGSRLQHIKHSTLSYFKMERERF